MPTYRVDAILAYSTELPRDVAINTFHVFSEDPLSGEGAANDIFDAVEDFYNGANTTLPVGDYLSSTIARGGSKCRLTVRNVEADGPPLYERFWSLDSTSSSTQLPLEVACCLSYRGANPGGVPAGRTRGRIYVGPLNTTAQNGGGDVLSRPSSGFRADLAVAAGRLRSDLLAADAPWVVYSRVGEDSWTVTGGWIDDTWDTQRRRGVEATTRTTWGS